MSMLFDAMSEKDARTTNGAITHSTSGQANVDLFFIVGASRGKSIRAEFTKAYRENMDYAVRILQWARDVRGGAGERGIFIDLLRTLCTLNRAHAISILYKTPEIGRWKDVVEMFNSPLRAEVLDMLEFALRSEDSLAAKWIPRKGPVASALARHTKMSSKQLRQTLVALSNTVEQKMCARQWNDIDFSKLPSIASSRYQKAFHRQAPTAYTKYLESLEKGETKINAGAIYPHTIVGNLSNGVAAAAEAQWKALPNYMEGTNERILPVVDVSGSMSCPVDGSGTVSCMTVAVSLGLYIAERNEGVFHNQFVTFSEEPTFVTLTKPTLQGRYGELSRSDWGYNTDLQRTFSILLDRAVKCAVPQDQMPTKILILSDMEFDAACEGTTNYDAIERKYAAAGYKMPSIVFWNLHARSGNVPVKAGVRNTALISGFSPAILTSVLGCQTMTPLSVMQDAIMKDRYDWIV